MTTIQMNQIIELVSEYIGIRYGMVTINYNTGNIINHYPMYGYCDSLPELKNIKKIGINSIGLINIIRHKLNKRIPNNYYYQQFNGSIGCWNRALINYYGYRELIPKCNNHLEYKIGTLFLRTFKDNSLGHAAIYLGNNLIINSYTNDYYDNNHLSDPGVIIENIYEIKFFEMKYLQIEQYFDYAIDWDVWTSL